MYAITSSLINCLLSIMLLYAIIESAGVSINSALDNIFRTRLLAYLIPVKVGSN